MKKQKPYPYEDGRDLRHAWQRQSDEVLYSEGQQHLFTRTVICMRCETMRVDTYRVPSRGQHLMLRVGSKYRYAKDYQVTGGCDTNAMRYQMLERARRLSKLEVVS
jgi:hypothetical protein